MLLEVEGINPGGHNRAGVNYDAPCLLEASKGLEAQPGHGVYPVQVDSAAPYLLSRHAAAPCLQSGLRGVQVQGAAARQQHRVSAVGDEVPGHGLADVTRRAGDEG